MKDMVYRINVYLEIPLSVVYLKPQNSFKTSTIWNTDLQG